MEAQSFSVKRAEVEFHSFAALGEPERAVATYAEENARRASILRQHLSFVGEMSPFLEIGANIGHSSYMMANEFGASGFALDISADALRYGSVLQERWGLSRAPVRVAGDAANLPFRDGSLRFVLAFQMLSQFMSIESVFLEVKRVLAPGGVFFFSEEPVRRRLSLRLYRCPYYDTMKPWERKLHDWGLLGYLVQDVIGAHQEESFGIRQNHTMGFDDWHQLIRKHFAESEYEIFVPERGWGERWLKRAVSGRDRQHPAWGAARLLGGTLSAFCKKAGPAPQAQPSAALEQFEALLQCPDCRGPVTRDAEDTLRCPRCRYEAAVEGGVYNLLPSAERKELYPGDRADIIDFSLPNHVAQLGEGFHELEGVYGNKYRWIGPRVTARLRRVNDGPQRLRVRGHVHEAQFQQGKPVQVAVQVNGQPVKQWTLDRPGLTILEADVPDAGEYQVQIDCSPSWHAPGDDRTLTLNLSMIRLVPRE